ncbi:response regulator transcription factor [Salinispora fenicalii]|uniref:response regulator transcription factor n=1 Tax=Salinispora fenicalii TaxID=1137263 RepID=UPI000371A538|nr:response regulator transcription factor [Salinispora fenicalii]
MHVLAVEHDEHAAERLVACARRLGHHTSLVRTGRKALASFDNSDFVLLDLDLPDVDGLDVCRAIRAAGSTPIIAFTGGGGETDRVLGLQAGADDCITKPYGLRELAARIEAVLRRTGGNRDAGTVQRGPLRIYPARREATLHKRTLSLTRKEFDLLHLLASNPERILTREELMARIWQDGEAVNRRSSRASRTLDTHVGTLRNKIGSGTTIVTVRGVGFRLSISELHALAT